METHDSALEEGYDDLRSQQAMTDSPTGPRGEFGVRPESRGVAARRRRSANWHPMRGGPDRLKLVRWTMQGPRRRRMRGSFLDRRSDARDVLRRRRGLHPGWPSLAKVMTRDDTWPLKECRTAHLRAVREAFGRRRRKSRATA